VPRPAAKIMAFIYASIVLFIAPSLLRLGGDISPVVGL
jgi:hypothetical protein